MSLVTSMADIRDWPAWTEHANVPVTYPAHYLMLADARGLDGDALLAAAGLQRAHLGVPGERVSLAAFLRFMRSLLAAGQGDVGLEAGLRMPLTTHGNLGYALLCASSPREALDVLQRYWHLRGRGLHCHWTISDDALVFHFEPELALPPDLSRLLLEGVTLSFCQGLQFLLGNANLPGHVDFPFPCPDYLREPRERLPRLRHDQPDCRVVITGLDWLDRPLPTGSPEALQQALSLCEQESARWGDQGQSSWLSRARAEMMLSDSGYPDPPALASRLHVSLRTLRRRLAAEGSGYNQLLVEARDRDARRLLAGPEPEIRQVARLLGYDDPANFTRAFRARHGEPPSRYRARHLHA